MEKKNVAINGEMSFFYSIFEECLQLYIYYHTVAMQRELIKVDYKNVSKQQAQYI
jgi:hypothetical protein